MRNDPAWIIQSISDSDRITRSFQELAILCQDEKELFFFWGGLIRDAYCNMRRTQVRQRFRNQCTFFFKFSIL